MNDEVNRRRGRPRKPANIETATENPKTRKGRKVYCIKCRFCVNGTWCSVKAKSVSQYALACEYGRHQIVLDRMRNGNA